MGRDHFLAAWNLAQRALVAAMMRARPAADILRRLRGVAVEDDFPFTLAQRARWGAAMRARAEADMVRRAPILFLASGFWMNL